MVQRSRLSLPTQGLRVPTLVGAGWGWGTKIPTCLQAEKAKHKHRNKFKTFKKVHFTRIGGLPIKEFSIADGKLIIK